MPAMNYVRIAEKYDTYVKDFNPHERRVRGLYTPFISRED